MLVLNGLRNALKEYTLTSEVNGLLGQQYPAPTFYVSFSEEKNSREDILAAHSKDSKSLKELKAFHSYDEKVGMPKLGVYIQRTSHQIFQRTVAPTIKAQISSRVVKTKHKLEQNAAMQRTIQPSELRAFSSRYLMDYLHAFKAALNGSAGDPLLNGETLAEEKEALGLGQGWLISASLRTPLECSDKSVTNKDTRVLGRKAFVRLMDDLDNAVKAAPLSDVSASLLSSCGPARSGLKPDFAMAASDVAAKRCRDVLFPILSDALKRAAHICKNLTNAAESAMRKRLSRSNSAISHAPFFHAAIRDIVHDFVDLQVSRCSASLEDEFRSTSCIPLHLEALLSGSQPTTEESELQKIGSLSSNVVEELRARILEDTKLKLFEYLLNPLGEVVQNFVQSKISSIHFEEIESMLEPEAARARLMEEQIRYDQDQKMNNEYTRIFNQNINDLRY